MAFRRSSYWNIKTELEAFLIFKKLEKDNFPRGEQIKLCRIMSKNYNLTEGNISAKVCNYKSIAGINNSSNASNETKEVYKKYKTISIENLENIINGL